MRIRKVTAHAFGPLAGETLEFADGMTVVVGDNESAKSSWHAAICAALCGRRRGRGRPREDEQRFIDLHKPWDGDDWLVSAEIVLDDGRRIELRQDLAGKVDCHAKDLDIGDDVSAQVMNEGAPDGACWLGLDRSSFLATACVEQAQVLRVLDGADGLQRHLQRAASTAGADATAAAALSLIENFQREQVGSNRVNSSKPLRRALDEAQHSKEQWETARQTHDRYLLLAKHADELRADAERADADVLAHEAAAAAVVAAEATEHVRRAEGLSAAIGDAPPAAAAEDNALAQQVTEALTSWRGQPPLPVLTGPTAAQLQAEVDALPTMPEGDLDIYISVTEALNALRSAEERLAQLEDDQPSAPAAATTALAASDQELADLALALEAPATGVDPGLEAAEEEARRDLETARGRARSATMIFAVAGIAAIAAAALLASRHMAAGAVALAAALVLAAFGAVRRRAGSVSGAQLQHAKASAKVAAAGQQAADVHRRRDEAIQRCGQLGLAPDPRALRRVLAERAKAASYHADLLRWEKSHVELQEKVTSASDALLHALSARGQRVTSAVRPDLMAAVEEYRHTCVQRAQQALQAGRREHMTAQLETRQQQERRAEEDQRNRNRAATLMTEAGAACGLPVDSPEVTAATLEKWLAQRSERMAEVDETRRQAAELEALLSGRTLGDLTQEAETASLKATQLAAQADRHLLAEVDPATSAERIPALRSRARDANKHSAEALGELRQFTASVTSVAEAEEALEAAKAGLRRVQQLQETLDLTRQLLEEAQNRVHRDIAPVIAATLREWLSTITSGRYTDVTVNPGTLRIDVCGPSRRWRRAELLSHGTAEQIYLLLRITLADHLTKSHDTCPLILNDVTVHADAARKNEILALLLKIAERRQIIIFTQEQQTAGWARERLSAPGHAIRTLSSLPAT